MYLQTRIMLREHLSFASVLDHENLGIEMVVAAFVRYMASVKAKIHPRKAKVDTTCLPENGRN